MQPRDSFILPALSMGLIHYSISFGLIVANLRGGKTGGDPAVLLHFVLALPAALILYLTAKRIRNRPPLRLFAVLTALIGLFCAVVPLLPGDLPMRLFNGNPPVVSISAVLFLPVGLTLFFRAAPAGREGFFYGLVMALGELVWVALFPLLGGADADPTASGRAFHLYALNCLTMGGAGLCLGAAVYRHDAPHMPKAPPVSAATRAALLRVFGAGLGMFLLLGLEMGMSLPKTALAPDLIGLPQSLPLFFLPLAGWMLDGDAPDRLMLALIPACLLAPLLGLAQANGLLDPLALFCLLAALREILLLAAFTVCARLMKTHTLLPLLLALAHCLYLTQLGGEFLRGRLAALPYGVFTAALVLAGATACCLWRFRRLLLDKPQLWEFPPVKKAAPSLDTENIQRFAVAHDLTPREREVFFGLIRGASLEDLGRDLGVSLSTIRYHQTGLLRKTGMSSRRKLLDHFIAWESRLPSENS
jgi:DNA-binding CsgD family transcriptional regulator